MESKFSTSHKATDNTLLDGALVDTIDVGDVSTIQNRWNELGDDVQEHYKQFGVTAEDLAKASTVAENLSLQDAREILDKYLQEHGDDMLIPQENTNRVREVYSRLQSNEKVDTDLETEAKLEAALISSNSVYREVRAVFDPVDNVDELCGTLRAWFLGILWSTGLSALNQFYSIRQPTITVTVYLAQIFSFVMGKAMERALPKTVFLPKSRFAFSLNPGSFTLKEHMLITIMCNVTIHVPSIGNLFFIQKLPLFLGQPWAGDFGYQLCILLGTQLLGFGLAGACRRCLVHPAKLIWFFTLPQGMLNKTLHSGLNLPANGWKISQFKFFFIAFAGMFCYFWLPNTIFPTLTFFNWISWIKPTSAALSIITGSYYFNLGFTPFSSFDWNWFTTIDPLVTPFFVVLQIVAFQFFWGLLVIVPVFFSNIWWTAYLPINSWFAYDNTGQIYQTERILNPDFTFNQTKYEEYSPIFLAASRTLRFASQFAILPTILVFAALWFGSAIKSTFIQSMKQKGDLGSHSDVHSRMMSSYKEVSEWVFAGVGVIAAALLFASFYAWPTGAPWWIVPMTFGIATVFVIPMGLIVAITGYLPALDIIYQLVGGYIFQGKMVPFLIFVTAGGNITNQAIYFVQDMKLGHYAKVPPRQMVAAQIVATLFCACSTLGVIQFQTTGIPNVCDSSKELKWICATAASEWSMALQWAGAGSDKLFNSSTGLYTSLLYAFPAGLLWPLPWYFGRKKWPNSFFRYCHPPAMMVGSLLWAPLNFSNVWQALPISWVVGVWIKTRYLAWWSKYVYVLSCALTAGIAFSGIIQFFAIDYSNAIIPSWWGTTQYSSTCDFQDCRYLEVAPGETFGPTTWH